MPHIHIGIAQLFVGYLGWVLFHTIVQFVAIQLHGTRFGQALAYFG